ncbi:MAG TPA: type I methionyl aminopeptidase [Candidatus Saccharibacteria bacterium]|nr:type I methionyl aminopeptidase [Candidatus Saccharibacteria bacterium]
MTQPPKTEAQIQAMREGGKILATIFDGLKKQLSVGMTGLQADAWVEAEIQRLGAEATYKTSEVNFPNVICISVNDAIVHGVPTDIPFEKGDVVGFDLVITYKGMKTDSAFTAVIGEEPSGAVKHLLKNTERSLYAGIDAIKGRGTHIGDISAAVESVLVDAKLGVIREMVGHGVGLEMHMPPEVPNYGMAGTGLVLTPGETIAIEPMATLGGERVSHDHEDGWTISTRDGSLAAQFEHTVLITEDGAEILTTL